jgi:hypothetical protein
MTVRTRSAALAATIALFGASHAAATDGNLYSAGPQANWLVGTGTTISRPQPNVWQIEMPATTLAVTGDKWAMSWGCPVPGSEVASVNWSALRWATYSSLAVEVVTEAGIEQHIPDIQLPQSPSGGLPYAYAPPGGRCSATLRLRQTQAVAQQRRIYWIGDPHVYFRDLTAPSVGIRTWPQGWLNSAATQIALGWSASDNFGADGVLAHSISVAGLPKWSASVGVGDMGAVVDLNGVPDGYQLVVVNVAGDGTAAGQAVQGIYVDRTPPSATAPVTSDAGDPGVATVQWSAGDATSNVASSQIEVNTAADGTALGAWTSVGLPVHGSGSLVAGRVDLTKFASGIHAIRVRVTDNAGNAAYSAPGTVVVDTTPPVITINPAPPTDHIRTLPLTLTLADDLAAHWGLGNTTIEANTAPDGGVTGTWVALHGPAILAAGQHRLSLPLTGLIDGPHRVRITTTNGGVSGGKLVTSTNFVVNVDQTSPTLTDVSFRHSGPDRVDVGWIGSDARAGVARAKVEWLDGSVWRVLTDAPAANGIGAAVLDISQLPAGAHQLRLAVSDAAGNTSTVVAAASVATDHTPPALTGLRLEGGPPWRLSWHIDAAEAGACATKVLVSGPQTDGQWREIATATTELGPHSLILPLDGFAPGAYRVQVSVCDAVGNTATVETAGLLLKAPTGAPAVVTATRVASRLTDARLTVRLPGRRAVTVGGRPRFTTRVDYGQRVRLTGRLLDAQGVPIAAAELQVRIADTVAGSARTNSAGAFSMSIKPGRSGLAQVLVLTDSGLVAVHANADLRIRVSPTVTLAASSRTAVALGAPITFRGRVAPGPASIVGKHRKTVTLEWRDPSRRTWRPVVNTTVNGDGTFSIAWRFQARGQRIPMRVRVPAELGWNLEERTSRSITIAVR